MDTKICGDCGQEKPLTEFHVDRRRADGRKRDCSSCVNERDREPARGRYDVRARTQRAWAKGKTQRLRAEAIAAYGGVCGCCGEAEPRFLTFDHPGGIVPDEHRRPDGKRLGSLRLYLLLKSQGWPPTVRLRCWNCNSGAALNGGVCPHENALKAVI